MEGTGKLRAYRHAILLGLFLIFLTASTAQAGGGGVVQELTGEIAKGNVLIYSVPQLKEKSTLYVYASGTSGNFDPLVAVTSSESKIENLRQDIADTVRSALATKENPQSVYKELASNYFLAWNDDSNLHDAGLQFVIPADGDYRVVLMSAISNENLRHFDPILTSGRYRMLIGIDSPEVLTGEVASKGETLAHLDRPNPEAIHAVQKLNGRLLTHERESEFYLLRDFKAGDTLYVYVKATAGNFVPEMRLNDYSSKPLAIAKSKTDERSCQFIHQFKQGAKNCSLHVSGESTDGEAPFGDFELVVGLNAPEVLAGNVHDAGPPIIKKPTRVEVGLRIQQITHVDQQSENFAIVGSLEMRWNDPKLAFNPDTCKCTFKTFTKSGFVRYVEDKGTLWPAFTFYNQQGNRWSQNQLVAVFSSGQALYFERFSATFQAPDFDFRKYPFDTQAFFVRIDSLYPAPIFTFEKLSGYSQLGNLLGEEQWQPTEFTTSLSTVYSSTDWPTSQFNVKILATRHIDYYIFRIFLPIFFILTVSWITFFSKDYDKRIDVSSANLLLFVAFNFVIANDLPRLGYLTFLDAVIVASFVLTSLGVIYNVILKRLELSGKHAAAQKIDGYLTWFYPLLFLGAIAVLYRLFS